MSMLGRKMTSDVDGNPFPPAPELTCGACGGSLVELGALGVRKHFRCRSCGANSSFAPAEEKKATRTKTRIKVRAHFDRTGGMVDGEMVVDKETGTVTVREKGMRRSYSMRLSEVVDFIARRGLGVG